MATLGLTTYRHNNNIKSAVLLCLFPVLLLALLGFILPKPSDGGERIAHADGADAVPDHVRHPGDGQVGVPPLDAGHRRPDPGHGPERCAGLQGDGLQRQQLVIDGRRIEVGVTEKR